MTRAPFRLPFPLRGFLYELRRTLLSIPLLAILVLTVLVSLTAVSSYAAPSPGGGFISVSSFYWYASGQFHFRFYAFDHYGAAAGGILFNLSVLKPVYLSPVANLTGSTGPSGSLDLLATLPEAPYNTSLLVTRSDGSCGDLEYCGNVYFGTLTALPRGAPSVMYGHFCNQVIHPTSDSFVTELSVLFPGPNGTAPDYGVYWAGPFNVTYNASALPPLPAANMTHLGAATSLPQIFPFTITNVSSNPQVIQVELFSPSGKLVVEDTNLSAGEFVPVPPPTFEARLTWAQLRATDFSETILAFVVPLLAVLGAFTVYGRDRASGVLESTLAGPVSRTGLALSRYLALMGALGIAVAISVGVLNGIADWFLQVALPAYVLGAIFLGLWLEAAIFAGLVLLASRLLRSPAVVLGVGLGLFALFSIFWTSFQQMLLGAFYPPPQSFDAQAVFVLQVEVALLNPTQLVYLYLTAATITVPAIPSQVLVMIALATMMWVLVPLGLFFWHVRKRD